MRETTEREKRKKEKGESRDEMGEVASSSSPLSSYRDTSTSHFRISLLQSRAFSTEPSNPRREPGNSHGKLQMSIDAAPTASVALPLPSDDSAQDSSSSEEVAASKQHYEPTFDQIGGSRLQVSHAPLDSAPSRAPPPCPRGSTQCKTSNVSEYPRDGASPS